MTITWRTEQRTLRDLSPWERNPRRINSREAQRLTESFDQFGQVQTIAVGPGNEVLDGHQRLKVLAEAHGLDYAVDVRVASRPLTEKEREKLVILLHRGAVGEWDWDSLGGWDMGDLVSWGFDEAELSAHGFEADGAGTDTEPQIDKAEELREKWGTSLGQLWALGEHRLACGDCTDGAVVERLMDGERANAVVTDPPYGQNQNGVTNDEPEKLEAIINGCVKALPCDNAVILAFASPRTFPVWLDATRRAGYKFERMLWMYKAAQETFPWRGWLLTSEAILASSLGQGHWQDVHPYSHDCYYKSEVSGQLDESLGWHGSVKPLDVVSDLIARVSANGQLVYDPFVGSGTTIIACTNLKRRCRAIEISAAYVAVCLERFHQHTGIEPELVDGL